MKINNLFFIYVLYCSPVALQRRKGATTFINIYYIYPPHNYHY